MGLEDHWQLTVDVQADLLVGLLISEERTRLEIIAC